jgi:hypothetical protein
MGLTEKDLVECGASSFLSWAADNAVTIFI